MKLSSIIFLFLSFNYGSAILFTQKKVHRSTPLILTEPFKKPSQGWFNQKLDHFQPTNNITWKQLYFVNDNYYDFQNPGSVFIKLGGESPSDFFDLMSGSIDDNAIKYKALCFLLEHRYYGFSRPTEDLSEENLKYLSSQQALADTANFITAMNKKYKLKKDVKWIAFGGSYAGSLAAWLRMKYPHLVHGAVSSSGPLLAKADFVEYYEVVISSLREKTGNDKCAEAIKTGIRMIESAMKVNPKLVEEKFNVCAPFENANKDDIRLFYNIIANHIAGTVQYDENISIKYECEQLTDETYGTPLERLAKLFYNPYNLECFDYDYSSGIEIIRNISYDTPHRQWSYQVCTEFSFHQSSTKVAEYFGDYFPFEFFAKQCQDIFGSKYDEDFIKSAVERTNMEYGGLNIKESNVVYVHGTIDPWHALGITKTIHRDAPAIFINGTSHCADTGLAMASDSPELKAAREEVKKIIGIWLGQTF